MSRTNLPVEPSCLESDSASSEMENTGSRGSSRAASSGEIPSSFLSRGTSGMRGEVDDSESEEEEGEWCGSGSEEKRGPGAPLLADDCAGAREGEGDLDGDEIGEKSRWMKSWVVVGATEEGGGDAVSMSMSKSSTSLLATAGVNAGLGAEAGTSVTTGATLAMGASDIAGGCAAGAGGRGVGAGVGADGSVVGAACTGVTVTGAGADADAGVGAGAGAGAGAGVEFETGGGAGSG